MLIICEDCAKRYNIDESRIKSNRARFTCKECGHIIIVEKSDTTRRLISTTSSPQPSRDENGSLDLIREMEDAADSSISRQGLGSVSERVATKRKKTAPVLFYFLLGLLAAFLCTSIVLGYLYFAYLADRLRETGTQAEFLISAFLLLSLAWALVLGVFFLIARILAKSITRLKDDVARLIRGEHGGAITSKGPREIRELADSLSETVHFSK
ncbi:MAG: zinc-ribbon domain-containing protein [Desulfobulbaceae bacterium]|nr:zinc-ribbon domain-containing protein [Desulfobulbaceae bacterium]